MFKMASFAQQIGIPNVALSTENSRRRSSGAKLSRRVRLSLLYVLGAVFFLWFPSAGRAQTFGCTPAMANDIVCENSKTGTPSSTWQISGVGDSTIQGFATDISVNRGQTVSFKVNTNAKSYRLDIYRMGYYGGNGARLIASVSPSVTLPQAQPACLTDSATRLYDCGNWAVSASWAVPSNATSGIYFAKLIRTDTGGSSHIVFIVRNDSSHSDILFKTSDSSWQAYNDNGTGSLYGAAGGGPVSTRSYKVSYNRPFNTRNTEAISWVFGAEYPMVRWLELNGFDVTYFTSVDTDRNGSLVQNHKLFMSTGHDEYWSGGMRTSVEAARDAGVNLAFFSGNEVFWKTRWENSIDGSGTPYRTMVCYKETLSGSQLDPMDPPIWTGTWRDPRFSPPADGGRPENGLTGTIFMVNGPGTDNDGLSIKVPSADGKMRFWRNTSISNLSSGQTATLPRGTLGYEWDIADDNGFRPAGLFQLSTTTQSLTSDYLLDYGGVYGSGVATHHLTLYRAHSGALVFGAGTVQWSWGLDNNHDNAFDFATPAPSADMQQATINLFADMNVQPATIQGGLLLATKSTDATPPISTITSPTSGANLSVGVQVTVAGTASDGGGGVIGGVEVSADGGQTWHPADGRASWTYAFTPEQMGPLTLMSCATDDSGNIETPGPGVSVTVPGPYSISGTISPSTIGNGTTVTLGGTSSASVTANSSGNYTFSGLISGIYSVTPSKTGSSFSPVSTAVPVTGASVSGVNFAGSQSSGTTYSISGSVTPAANGSGITITLTGAATASTVTDASGSFSVAGLPNGSYTITPSKLNFGFSPAQSSVTVAGANISGIAFTAIVTAQTLFTTQVPAELSQSDGTNLNYELGTLIQSNTAGQVTAIR
ncbi:MAG: carboxypeptidase regulatory-like domain-containing protein, partial [Acidobacteriia bacterium]|nr:carboxypeptidase regulatory-like domain-containing protein [Terriglobia bacterium]